MSVAYYETAKQEDIDFGSGVTTKRNPGGGVLSATQVGIHSLAVGQASVSAAWAPGVVAAGGTATTTVNVPGAVKGDFVLRSYDQDLQGCQLTTDVNSDGVVTAVIANLTGGAITLASGNLKVVALRSR